MPPSKCLLLKSSGVCVFPRLYPGYRKPGSSVRSRAVDLSIRDLSPMSDEVSHDNTPAIHRARELSIRQQHIQLLFKTYIDLLLIDDPLSGSRPSVVLLDDIVALITYQVNRYLNLYKERPFHSSFAAISDTATRTDSPLIMILPLSLISQCRYPPLLDA